MVLVGLFFLSRKWQESMLGMELWGKSNQGYEIRVRYSRRVLGMFWVKIGLLLSLVFIFTLLLIIMVKTYS